MAPIRRIVFTVVAKIWLEFSAMANREIPLSGNRLVWYAVYGSNLLRSRFDCYIQGGKLKGATKEYAGCRDKTPPRDARRVMLAHSIYFATDGAIAARRLAGKYQTDLPTVPGRRAGAADEEAG
jgi:hypothetical protein